MGRLNIYDETITTVDHKTGEVVESVKKSVSKRNNTNEFIMLFVEGIDLLTKSDLTKTQKSVLVELLKYTTNNSNMLFINKEVKKLISKDTGLAFRTVDDKIRDLVEKKIIFKEGQTRFLNPLIFGRGEFQNVRKLRQHFELEYDFENETAFERTTNKFLYNEEQDLSKLKVIESKETKIGNHTEQEIVLDNIDQEHPNQTVINFDEPKNGKSLELELTKEQNKKLELENEQLKLKLELVKVKDQ